MELFWIKYEIAVFTIYCLSSLFVSIFLIFKLRRLIAEKRVLEEKFVKISVGNPNIEKEISYCILILVFSIPGFILLLKALIEKF